MKMLRSTVAATALIVSLAAATQVSAQETTPPPADQAKLSQDSQSAPGGPTSAVAPEPASAGDIIVTANKRAENVQRVPLAVSVVAPPSSPRPVFATSPTSVRSPRRWSSGRPNSRRTPTSRCVASAPSPSASAWSRASRCWSTKCRWRSRRAPSPTCPMSSGSRCCAGRRARCTASRPRRSGQSHHPQPDLGTARPRQCGGDDRP